MTPTANRKPSDAGVPTRTATPKKPTPTATATAAMIRETRSSSRRSGVGAGRWAPVRLAMSGEPVCGPGRDDGGVGPRPRRRSSRRAPSRRHRVGGHALAGQRRRVDGEGVHGVEAQVGRDPVALAEQHESPTTRSSAAISIGTPSRTTVTRRGRRSRSRSAACSARCSCTNANTPLSTITTKTATPSCGRPATNASAPGHPEQQGEEVDHLRGEAPPRRRAGRHRQHVRAVGREAGRGFVRGERDRVSARVSSAVTRPPHR